MNDKFTRYIQESTLSRVFGHIQSGQSFGVVSAFRSEYSRPENLKRHENLKTAIRALGLGFIEMKGGYKGDQGFVEELSTFIPNISKQNILGLGQKFDQHSVIFKDSSQFSLVGTNDASGVGKVLANFATGKRDSLELAQSAMQDFFSALTKGSHRGKKFLFSMKEFYEPTFMERAYAKAKPQWKVIYEQDIQE